MFQDSLLEAVLIDYENGIVEPVWQYREEFEKKKNSLWIQFGQGSGSSQTQDEEIDQLFANWKTAPKRV